MSPKVSVIIPVYNVESYLPRSLDSVINQTLKDIEIICINDGSTDNSLDILKEYASKDKRIKIIDLAVNQGVANARNIGLENVKGEYVGFVDPDDYIDLNFYEELYKKAQETNADIVKCEFITIETDGSRKKSISNFRIQTISKFCFSNEYTSAIYKSSLIFGNNITFPTDIIVGEDSVFLHKVVIKAKRINLISNVFYYYVRRENSLNTKLYSEKKIKDAIKAMEYRAENYNDALGKELTESEYLQQYSSNIFALISVTTTRTKNRDNVSLCITKVIELFNKCKLHSKLINLFLNKYSLILHYIENNDVEALVNISLKYENIHNYCMLAELRGRVKEDLKYTDVLQ